MDRRKKFTHTFHPAMRVMAGALVAAFLVAGTAAQAVNCSNPLPLDTSTALTFINGTKTSLGAVAGKATLVANTASF